MLFFPGAYLTSIEQIFDSFEPVANTSDENTYDILSLAVDSVDPRYVLNSFGMLFFH